MVLGIETVYNKQGIKVEHRLRTDGQIEMQMKSGNCYFTTITPTEARELAEVLIRSADEIEHQQEAQNETKNDEQGEAVEGTAEPIYVCSNDGKEIKGKPFRAGDSGHFFCDEDCFYEHDAALMDKLRGKYQ